MNRFEKSSLFQRLATTWLGCTKSVRNSFNKVTVKITNSLLQKLYFFQYGTYRRLYDIDIICSIVFIYTVHYIIQHRRYIITQNT
ncbi:unnamed protein product [Rhizophagus irregularis]|nr:unnamed protein product [Rhizophagus irregularis]